MTARQARGAVRQILSDSGAFSSRAGERLMAQALQGLEAAERSAGRTGGGSAADVLRAARKAQVGRPVRAP